MSPNPAVRASRPERLPVNKAPRKTFGDPREISMPCRRAARAASRFTGNSESVTPNRLTAATFSAESSSWLASRIELPGRSAPAFHLQGVLRQIFWVFQKAQV
jgi:hypothetical protein